MHWSVRSLAGRAAAHEFDWQALEPAEISRAVTGLNFQYLPAVRQKSTGEIG
jgi:hypothetical protein